MGNEYRVNMEFQEIANINVSGGGNIKAIGKLTGCDMVNIIVNKAVNTAVNKDFHVESNDKILIYDLYN